MKLFGYADRAIHRSPKQANFTYGTKIDSYFPGSPIAIPTTEPGTSQFITTVTSNMLLSVSDSFWNFDNGMQFCVAGVNSIASAITLNYRILKNSVSRYTSSTSVVANGYWSISGMRCSPCVAGDVLEVRMWASQTGLNLEYEGLQFIPWNVRPAKLLWVDNLQIYSNGYTAFTNGLAPHVYSTPGILYTTLSSLVTGGNCTGYGSWQSLNGLKLDPANFNMCPSNTGFVSRSEQSLAWSAATAYLPAYYGYNTIDKIAWTPMQI